MGVDTSAPAGPASRWLPAVLLVLAFAEGGSVMIAELVGAKMLAPLYGSSLYVWGAVIGITLISLTAGYYLGGVLSYRRHRRELVCWFLLAAALLIILMPRIAHALMMTLGDMGTIRAILLLTSLYLFPPLLLLGATTPLIISVLASEVREAGNVAGRVYAISTVGGILATFGAGFWLIPQFGLTRTALAGGIALSLLPLALLLRQRRWPALAFPLVLVILVLPRTEETSHPDVTILYQSEGLLGQLKVADVTYRDEAGRVTGTDRLLFVNRTAQTWIHRDSGEPAWDYVRFLTSLGSLAPAGSRALLLGLGGGIVARELQQVGHIVDSVELDERIARIARDYFGLESNGDVIVDDGRHFLRSTDRRYDLIMFDVFQAEVPPAHMLTLEAFRELRRLLNPGGFVVINYSGFISGSTGRGARSIYRTLREAGFQVQLLSTGAEEATSNNLMIAADHEVDLGAPRAPIIVGRGVRPLADFVRDTGELDFDDALLLVDNRPILERLNLEAAAVWRRGYYEYFTRPFVEKGIPLFD